MRYHNITKEDMLNGCGLRVVLWVAGCEHHCPGCHNPETWDVEGGVPFDDEARTELFEALSKDYIKGITFSGGDPLHPCNIEYVKDLCAAIRREFVDKDIWIYTGYEVEKYDELKKFIDTVIVRTDYVNGVATTVQYRLADYIVDGEFIESLKDNKLRWRGSSNQKIWHLTIEGAEDVTEKFDKDMQEDDYSENYLSGEKVKCNC